jgi:hypothetical protein
VEAVPHMNLDTRICEIFEKYLAAHNALMSFMGDVERSIESLNKQHDEIIQKLELAGVAETGEEQTSVPPDSIEIHFTDIELTTLRNVMGRKLTILQSYPDLLLRSTFIYAVALFDGLLGDAFSMVLMSRPEVMSTSKKQLTYDSIIRLHQSNELFQFMAAREINDISYGSIQDQARYYKERLGIDLSRSGVKILQLTQIRATRNLLVHNNGVVNSIYLEAVPHSTYKLGDTINVTTADVQEKSRALLAVAKFLRDAILKKFGTQPVPEIRISKT